MNYVEFEVLKKSDENYIVVFKDTSIDMGIGNYISAQKAYASGIDFFRMHKIKFLLYIPDWDY